jgi:hypothetical protein
MQFLIVLFGGGENREACMMYRTCLVERCEEQSIYSISKKRKKGGRKGKRKENPWGY